MSRGVLRMGLHLVSGLVMLGLIGGLVIYAVPGVVGAEASFVVLSGSMEPTISPGDVVIVERTPPSEIEKGDVVTYYREESDRVPTTHRVVDVVRTDTGRAFVTKGDNNAEPDPGTVPPKRVVGTVAFTIPYLGHVVTFVDSPTGFFTLVMLPFVSLVATEAYEFVRGRDEDEVDDDADVDWLTAIEADDEATTASIGGSPDDERGRVADSGDDQDGENGGDENSLSVPARVASVVPFGLTPTPGEGDDEADVTRDADEEGTDADDPLLALSGDAGDTDEDEDSDAVYELTSEDVRLTTAVIGVATLYAAFVAWRIVTPWAVSVAVGGVVATGLSAGLYRATATADEESASSRADGPVEMLSRPVRDRAAESAYRLPSMAALEAFAQQWDHPILRDTESGSFYTLADGVLYEYDPDAPADPRPPGRPSRDRHGIDPGRSTGGGPRDVAFDLMGDLKDPADRTGTSPGLDPDRIDLEDLFGPIADDLLVGDERWEDPFADEDGPFSDDVGPVDRQSSDETSGGDPVATSGDDTDDPFRNLDGTDPDSIVFGNGDPLSDGADRDGETDSGSPTGWTDDPATFGDITRSSEDSGVIDGGEERTNGSGPFETGGGSR